MVFAQVTNQIVVNTLVLKDNSMLDLFSLDPISGNPYDFVLQVDNTYPQPGIGWIFDGIMFYPPPVPPSDDSGE